LYRVHAWIALLDRAAPRERQAEPARRAVAAIEAKIAATRDFATKLVLGDHGTYRWNGLTFTVSRSWAVVHIECENEDYSPVAKGNGAQARIAPSLGPVTERPAPPAQDLPHRPSRALCATPESRKNLSAVLSENQQQVARYQAASALYYARLGQWKAQKLAKAGWTPAQKRAFERNLAIDPVIAAKNQRIADLMSGYLRQATTKQKQGDAKSSCDMAFAGVDLAYESATTAVAVQRRMQELYDAEAHRLNVSFD